MSRSGKRVGVTVLVWATLAGLVGPSALAAASTSTVSPFPRLLVMQRGLSQSSLVRARPWGSPMATSQVTVVGVTPSQPRVEWGVWRRHDGPTLFPVRSLDGGHHWSAAGPMLATDWAGGSLFYVTRVLAQSASAVVMVSNAVIDVTTDAGHVWYQYVNELDNWSMTRATLAGGIGLRVGPTSYAQLPPHAFAIYRLEVAHHRWLRVRHSP